MSRGMVSSWSRHALVGAVSIAVLSACSSGAAPAGPTLPSSGIAAPPTRAANRDSAPSVADAAKADALVAYRGMWADFVDAGHTSNWQSSKLGRYATGVALTNLSRSLYTDHRNGVVTRGEPVLNPVAMSTTPATDPSSVVVNDCGDSTHWLRYRADNGAFADTDNGGRQAINAVVKKQSDGSWKVSDFGVHQVGSC